MQVTLLTSQLNNKKTNWQSPLYFEGKNKVFSHRPTFLKIQKQPITDVFQPSNENLSQSYKKAIDSIWNRIQEQVSIFTPQDLEKAITKVQSIHPNSSEKEILTVMQKLTQWANYNCLPQIAQKMKDAEIKLISKTTFSITNDTFYYLLSKKKIFQRNEKGVYGAKFVTKSDITNQNYDNVYKYINLEGFEDGVNFLTDNNKLAELTSNVLSRTNIIRQENPKTSFKNALNTVLNGDIIYTLKKENFSFETISIDAPPTRETILKQINPYTIDSKDTIRTQLEKIADFLEPHKNNELIKTRIAQFFELKLDIYDKQRLVKLMKEMHVKINTFLENNHLSSDETYYIIRNPRKSYNLITQMYANVNDIPKDKIKKWEDVENLPNRSTIIILDDLAISGDSLCEIITSNIPKTSHVLFSPLIAHSNAVDNKIDHIMEYGRNRKDKVFKIILKDDNAPISKLETTLADYFQQNRYTNSIIGDNGYEIDNGKLGECTVLPYMAPDNNADLASLLAHNFLPTPEAIKNLHINFSDIMR